MLLIIEWNGNAASGSAVMYFCL